MQGSKGACSPVTASHCWQADLTQTRASSSVSASTTLDSRAPAALRPGAAAPQAGGSLCSALSDNGGRARRRTWLCRAPPALPTASAGLQTAGPLRAARTCTALPATAPAARRCTVSTSHLPVAGRRAVSRSAQAARGCGSGGHSDAATASSCSVNTAKAAAACTRQSKSSRQPAQTACNSGEMRTWGQGAAAHHTGSVRIAHSPSLGQQRRHPLVPSHEAQAARQHSVRRQSALTAFQLSQPDTTVGRQASTASTTGP